MTVKGVAARNNIINACNALSLSLDEQSSAIWHSFYDNLMPPDCRRLHVHVCEQQTWYYIS